MSNSSITETIKKFIESPLFKEFTEFCDNNQIPLFVSIADKEARKTSFMTTVEPPTSMDNFIPYPDNKMLLYPLIARTKLSPVEVISLIDTVLSMEEIREGVKNSTETKH